MFCTNCGEKIDERMKFCPQCGEKIITAKKILSEMEKSNTTAPKKRTVASGQKVTTFQEGMFYVYTFGANKAVIYLQEILDGTKKVKAVVQKDSMARQLYPNTKPVDQRFVKMKGTKDRYLAYVSAGNIVELSENNLAKVQEAFVFEGSLSALATMLSGESIAPVNAWRLAEEQVGTVPGVQQGILASDKQQNVVSATIENQQPVSATIVTQQRAVSNPVKGEPAKTRKENVQEQAKENTSNVSTDRKKTSIYWGEPMVEQKEETEEIDLDSFAGRFDEKSCYGRKFYDTISADCRPSYRDNFREYNGYLYFLNRKIKAGGKENVVTHVKGEAIRDSILHENYHLKNLLCTMLRQKYGDRPSYKYLNIYMYIFEEHMENREKEIPEWVSTKYLKEGYKSLFQSIYSIDRNEDKLDLQELDQLEEKIKIEDEMLQSAVQKFLEDNINRIIEGLIEKEWKKKNYYRLVFGRISLTDYKMEIIKEFTSVSLINNEREYNVGLLYNAHFSISHGKIWYVTCLNDDVDVPDKKQREYVVRCLDIDTKREAIVLKLPKGIRGRFPIVQGNIMTVMTDQRTILCYDLRTGKKTKKTCWNVCSYNEEYIFFKKDNELDSAFYAIETATGEVLAAKKLFQAKTEAKLEEIHYIDSYHKCIYVKANYKPETGGRKVKGWGILSFDGVFKPFDISVFKTPDMSRTGLDLRYDGRFEMLAFNGKSCCVTVRHEEALYITDLDGNVHRKELKRDGKYHQDAENYTLATANDIVICALDPKYVYMYHNNNWIPILKNRLDDYNV